MNTVGFTIKEPELNWLMNNNECCSLLSKADNHYVEDDSHLYVWEYIDWDRSNPLIDAFINLVGYLPSESFRFIKESICSYELWGQYMDNPFNLCITDNKLYYKQMNKHNNVSQLKEVPCGVCGRMNDIGVTECWCCGNKP